MIPPIISCLVGRVICENPQQQDHWTTRNRAASLIATICHQYGKAYHTLQPRITKTLLRAFLDPARPLTTQYGAIIGLDKIGPEVTRVLVAPNIKFYSENCLQSALESSNPMRVQEAEKCKEALVVSFTYIYIFFFFNFLTHILYRLYWIILQNKIVYHLLPNQKTIWTKMI